jgi:hypothetical protein
MTERTPVYHDPTLNWFKAFGTGDTLPAGLINLADLISSASGNQIVLDGTDHKLYVGLIGPDDLISADDGNTLILGADGRLYVGPCAFLFEELISADPGNLIVQGTDDKLFSLGCSINPFDLISQQDADNIIELGADGLLYADRNAPCTVVLTDAVSGDAGNVLTYGTDGLLFVPLNPCDIDIGALVSKDSGNIVEYGGDGLIYVPAPEPCALDIAGLISADADNKLTAGSDGLLTISYSDEMDITLHFDLDDQHDPYIYVSVPVRTDWAQWKYELRTSNGTDELGLGLRPVLADGTHEPVNYDITDDWAPVPSWFAAAQSIAFLAVPMAGNPVTAADILVSLRA